MLQLLSQIVPTRGWLCHLGGQSPGWRRGPRARSLTRARDICVDAWQADLVRGDANQIHLRPCDPADQTQGGPHEADGLGRDSRWPNKYHTSAGLNLSCVRECTARPVQPEQRRPSPPGQRASWHEQQRDMVCRHAAQYQQLCAAHDSKPSRLNQHGSGHVVSSVGAVLSRGPGGNSLEVLREAQDGKRIAVSRWGAPICSNLDQLRPVRATRRIPNCRS